ncbi:MAG: SEC-C domain-containing protein [Candidatus Margulisbacteria bacterium]|nr:SEC-C domain-containing protein [Candidatus Margulisiibacteriota bacterium]
MEIGRNDPCLCGSGKKHKHCCLGRTPRIALEYSPDKAPILKAIAEGMLLEVQNKQKEVNDILELNKPISLKEWDILSDQAKNMHREIFGCLDQVNKWTLSSSDTDPKIQSAKHVVNQLDLENSELIIQIESIKQRDQIKMDEPAIEIYENLYKTVDKFQELGPWQWINDTDLIVIELPNGEKYYGSILGSLEEFYACQFHIGEEGIIAFNELVRNADLLSEHDMSKKTHLYLSQRFIGVSYESKRDITLSDEKIFTKIGRRYRGKQGYPVVRLHEPGYPPQLPTIEDMKLLTLLLEQIMEVSKTSRDSSLKIKMDLFKDNKYIGRKGKEVDGKIIWKKATYERGIPRIEQYADTEVNEAKLELIRRQNYLKEGVWEIDNRYLPGLVNEDPRPYFARIILILNEDGLILRNPGICRPGRYNNVIAEIALDTMIKEGRIPKEIHVCQLANKLCMDRISTILDIDIHHVPQFKYLDTAMNQCLTHFGQFI